MAIAALRANQLERRGIFNLIGSISNSLFGTATESQVKALERSVGWARNMVGKAAEERQDLFNSMSLLANRTNARMDGIMHAVNASARAVSVLVNNLRQVSKQYAHDFTIVHKDMVAMGNHVAIHDKLLNVLNKKAVQNLLISNLDKWIKALDKILHGKLSPFLVPKEDLMIALQKLNNWCERERATVRPLVGIEFLQNYYDLSLLISAVVDDTLMVRYPIPLTDPTAHFRVYAIHKFPVPMHQKSKEQHIGYTLLRTEGDYLAISTDNSQSAILTRHDVEICKDKHAGFCKALAVTRSVNNPDCMTAIFFNMPDEIHERCDFQAYPNAKLPSNIFALQDNQYLLSNIPSPTTVICGNEIRHVPVGIYTVVTLPCHCHLRHDSYRTLDSFAQCPVSDSNFRVNVSHPINYPFFRALDLIAELPDPVTALQTVGKMDLRLPNISKYMETIDKSIRKDEELRLPVKQLGEATKKHDVAYYPDATPPIQYSWSPLTVDQYCLIGVGAYLIGLTVYCGYLNYKMVAMSALVIIDKVAGVEATSIHRIVVSPPPLEIVEKSVVPTIWLTADWGLKLIASIFILALLVHRIYYLIISIMGISPKIYWFWQCCVSPSDTSQYIHTFLKVASENECAIIYLCSIPY